MRIATWNLMRARPGKSTRLPKLLSHMQAINADVWVLTETHRDLAPGSDYCLAAMSRCAPDRETAHGECWVAIWVRTTKPVEGCAESDRTTCANAEPITVCAEPDRTACAKIWTKSGRAVLVYGTVLPWLSDSRWSERGATAFVRSLTNQAREWRQLRASDSATPLIVAGDFNQDLAPRHYYGSKEGRAVLTQELAQTGLTCLTAGAFDPVARISDSASVDHICISAGLRSTSVPISSAWPSHDKVTKRLTDHFGVWVDLADA